MQDIRSTRTTAPLEAIAAWHILVTHGSRFTRFGVVGILGIGVNTALLYVLSQVVGLDHLLAAALATEVTILFNFALNDRWTFRDAPATLSWIRRAARYNAIALAGLGISLAVFAVLMGELGLYYLGANLVAVGAATVWNYTINARFTW